MASQDADCCRPGDRAQPYRLLPRFLATPLHLETNGVDSQQMEVDGERRRTRLGGAGQPVAAARWRRDPVVRWRR
uniref:Uncharacterized protein n=1 Tax=Zea mays TaxID=4577 RepID=C0P6N2_MAIZE|nr:unknown [Zea mays]